MIYNSLFSGAKEEAEDLDLEWEDVAAATGGGGGGGGGKPGQVRGKGSPKKKSQSLPASSANSTFDPESSNSTGFINMGPGFSPFAPPLKKDDISYDWVRCALKFIYF